MPAKFFLPFLFISISVFSCSTPVFHYALQFWHPDLYAVDINESEVFDGALEELMEKARTPGSETYVNWFANRTKEQQSGSFSISLPGRKKQPPIYAAPLTVENLRKVFYSPVRKELVRRLIAEQTAVWLFLDSGDREKDDAAFARLEKLLRKCEKTLQLPAPEEGENYRKEGAAEAEAEDETRISFSTIRLRREDPKEAFLVRSLLASEPDLGGLNEPMTFPVFGRGRALYAIVGRGINEEVVMEAGSFLTGACSCQVKEQNPGVDLMLAADWESAINIELVEEVELPPLTSVSLKSEAPESSEPVDDEDVVAEEPVPEEVEVGLKPFSLALAGLLIVVVVGTAIVLLRGRDR